MALSGALLAEQKHGGTPTRVNYSMYAAVFSMLCLFYLIPASFINSMHHPLLALLLDALSFIFMLCAGIAVAASLGGENCDKRVCVLSCALFDLGGYGLMRE